MDYGDSIAAWRNHARLTQQALADALKWPQSRIGNYESHAREPGWAELSHIAEFFKVDVPTFLMGPPFGVAEAAATYRTNELSLEANLLIGVIRRYDHLARAQRVWTGLLAAINAAFGVEPDEQPS